MQILELHDFLERVHRVVGEQLVISSFDPGHPEYFKSVTRITQHAEDLHATCEKLDFSVTALQIKDVIAELRAIPEAINRGLPVDRHTVPSLVNLAIKTMSREASTRVFFRLPEPSRKLFVEVKPFGDLVNDTFPDANSDIEEAAKCLALQRSTASAFHSMRVVESGMRTLLDSFGDTKEYWSWGEMLSRIGREAGKSDDVVAPLWSGRRHRLTEISMLIAHVKNASRNPTIHIDRKLVYTIQNAEDVFSTTKALMRRLAEDFSEGRERRTPPRRVKEE